MCGIVGHINNNELTTEDKQLLGQAVNSIKHRGPDSSDVLYYKNVGLGHVRLSIMDLSDHGNQPMTNKNGKLSIIFNGEIYNHLELRKELTHLGYDFAGTSDTETILYGYQEWGNQLLKKLNGIFSLAILDRSHDKLIICRDRYGVKPLYYQIKENKIRFGSEIKVILDNKSSRKINKKALHEFLYYGYALDNRTLFEGIYKVLPGEILTIALSNLEITKSKFYQISSIEENTNNVDEKDIIQKTKSLLENAVKSQLLSDVPVGVFLSGGIDSSSIAAFASRYSTSKLNSFTAGFDFNEGNNELELAKKIAKKYDLNHHELFIQGKDLAHIIESLVCHHDEPFSDAANIPLYLLTQQLGTNNKVILQGDGGDELFAGYPRYHILKKYSLYKNILKTIGYIPQSLRPSYIDQKYDRFHTVFSEKEIGKFFGKMLTVESQENSPTRVLNKALRQDILLSNPFEYYEKVYQKAKNLNGLPQQMLHIDMQVILPNQFLEKVDKSTMANGIEVRVPYLDNELAEFAMKIPGALKVKNGVKKYILKKALEGIVPHEVLYGPKKGFGVPYGNWLKGPLKQFFYDSLHDPYVESLAIFDYMPIHQLMQDHIDGRKNNEFILWKLLNLSIWLKKYQISIH